MLKHVNINSCPQKRGESSETPLETPATSVVSTAPSESNERKTKSDSGGRTISVAYNRNGRRIGESHPNVRYTDHEVEQVIELREQGYSYRAISKMMDMPKTCCIYYCRGVLRAQLVDHWARKKK